MMTDPTRDDDSRSGASDSDTMNAGHFPTPGNYIGPYKILVTLGEGGFGIVYLAEQEKPIRRQVALKIIKLGMDTKQVVARFESERQALAMMDHPNIAKVFDAGATKTGRPYFVMELVRGRPITDYCDQERLGIESRLQLFTQVCRAVQHAHQKGIIHRDIKPSNVLVTTHGEGPVVKVIDFGIAKATAQSLTEQTLFTQQGLMIGTPAYMSPEQADMGTVDIDTRADIYSLGVLLYALLTGEEPFDPRALREAGLREIQRIIREVEPPRPSVKWTTLGAKSTEYAKRRSGESVSIRKILRRDLDWITMKALAKDRAQRYETAAALAQDVESFLKNEPVAAGPASFGYLAIKLFRRHRGPVTAGLLIIILAVVSAATMSLLYLRAERERVRANIALAAANDARAAEEKARTRAEDEAERAQSASELAEKERLRAEKALIEANVSRTAEMTARKKAEDETTRARRASARTAARFALQDERVADALASACEAYHLGGGNWEDGLLISEAVQISRRNWSLFCSLPPAGSSLSACFADRTGSDYFIFGSRDSVTVYDLNNSRIFSSCSLPVTGEVGMKYDAARSILAVTADKSLFSYKIPELKLLSRKDYGRRIQHMDARGGYILLVHDNGDIRIVNALTLSDVAATTWRILTAGQTLAFPRIAEMSPDGAAVLLHGGSWTENSFIWNWSQVPHVVTRHQFSLGDIAFLNANQVFTWFTPSGTGGHDEYLTLHELSNQKTKSSRRFSVSGRNTKGIVDLEVWSNRAGGVMAGLWGQCGGLLFDAANEGEVSCDRYENIWPFPDDPPKFLAGSMQRGWLALQTPSGIHIFTRRENNPVSQDITGFCAAACDEGMLTIRGLLLHFTPYDIARTPCSRSLQWLQSGRWHPWALWISQNGSNIAVAAQESLSGSNTVGDEYGRTVILLYRNVDWKNNSAALDIIQQIPLDIPPPSNPWSLRFLTLDEDLSVLAYWRQDIGVMTRYALPGGRRLDSLILGQKAACSPDGQFVAGEGASRNNVVVYNAASAQPVAVISNAVNFRHLTFTFDNRIAVACTMGTKIYDIHTGLLNDQIAGRLVPMAIHSNVNRYIAYQPDSAGVGGGIVLADTKTGAAVAMLSASGKEDYFSSFSPSGEAAVVVTDRWMASIYRPLDPSRAFHYLKQPQTIQSLQSAARPSVPPAAGPNIEKEVPLLLADDPDELRKHLGERITLEGRIYRTIPTRAGDALNLEFEGPAKTRAMGWIPPRVYGTLRTIPSEPLDGQRIRLTGNLGMYGGRNPYWKERYQITVDNPNQIVLISSEDASP